MAGRANARKTGSVPPASPEKEAGTANVSEAEQQAAGEAEVGFAPKTFLIPYMLLMLRDSVLHGYAIWEKLALMGIPGLTEGDRASIYRALRQLEREGKVCSEWDTTSDGPARRVYRLTQAGENFLQIWATGLNQYRQSLDFFFKLYTGGLAASPFGFNFQAAVWSNNPGITDKDKDNKEGK